MAAENQIYSLTVLTIAGFDPSGGAGIIADIRTFVHFGCRPTAAITSLTFQNSEGVFGAVHETAESLRAQILPIVEEFRVDAVKVGMLPTAELVHEVAGLIREGRLPAPVIDPVMQSSSGHRLMDDEGFEVLVTDLLARARLITPNIPEAEKLAGMNIDNEDDMRQAAARIRELGAGAVLIKGGHLKQESGVGSQESGRKAIDVLDNEGSVKTFRGEWISAQPVRGTGCMLSSAIAACLGKGMSLVESVSAAKEFIAAEIQDSTQN
ncbi:MAG TPA: bifunctional hydroxymethylpyrimidine kinase/phosphomethylpyrimidine kinase [Pyrinomonadaceae bacterium]|nr:bifunctional hydroxymethylpyrimidine kinase/phosphomethylpyrimidine kinase [Pyrinomonadaceae bacterium]